MRLDDLVPYERNPRTITESQFEKLKRSIIEDGYHSRIKVTHDMLVVGGHQRLRALRDLGFVEVTVLVPDRPLTKEEFERLLIRDNVNNGLFDMDMLADDFDLESLRDWGVHEIMNIAPMDDEGAEGGAAGGITMQCPQCGSHFPAKGNRA